MVSEDQFCKVELTMDNLSGNQYEEFFSSEIYADTKFKGAGIAQSKFVVRGKGVELAKANLSRG